MRKTVLGNRQLYRLLSSAVGGVVEVTLAGRAKRSALCLSCCGWNPLALIDIQKHHTPTPFTQSRTQNANTIANTSLIGYTRRQGAEGDSWSRAMWCR
jgi:hypothetical protein